MKTKSLKSLVLAVALGLPLLGEAQSGGAFTVLRSALSGGGASTGGTYSMNGTVGQPDAGAMSGGNFTVIGGFWSLPLDQSGLPPTLSVRLANASAVILSWPNHSAGYRLEQTANMNAPGGGWISVTQTPVVVGPNKEVTLPATGRFCMFRLRGL